MTATLVTRFSRSTLIPDIMFNTESLNCKNTVKAIMFPDFFNC